MRARRGVQRLAHVLPCYGAIGLPFLPQANGWDPNSDALESTLYPCAEYQQHHDPTDVDGRVPDPHSIVDPPELHVASPLEHPAISFITVLTLRFLSIEA